MPSLLRILVATFVAAFVSGLPATAWSQITVDRDAVVLDPGQPAVRSADIVVRNTGDTGVQASVVLEDWDVDATGTSRWRKPGQVAGSCGDRVSVSPSTMTLAPGEQRTVRVTLKSGARFDSECWSAAVVQPSGSSTAAATRSSVPLYVTPSGLNTDGEVNDMFVRGDSLVVNFRNTGKLRSDVVGEVQVRMADDSLVTVVPLEAATVLAGSERQWRIRMPKLATGKYKIYGVVDFGGASLTAAEAKLEIR